MAAGQRRGRFALLVGGTALMLAAASFSVGRDLPWLVAEQVGALSLPRLAPDELALDPERPDAPIVILVVGTDRRAGFPRMPGLGRLTGERADSVSLWQFDRTGMVGAVFLPRDLRVRLPGYGDMKLGATLEVGLRSLLQAVRELTGMPVHHYVEVDFGGLAPVVDGLHGLDILLTSAVRDDRIGLRLPQGQVRLDGRQALGLARSRTLSELGPDGWAVTSVGDLERIGRQQALLVALARRLAGAGPVTRMATARRLADGFRVDPALSRADLALFRLGVAGPGGSLGDRLCTLPTRLQLPAAEAMSPFPPSHDGSAVFRVPLQPAAAQLLGGLKGPAPIGPVAECHGGRP